MIGVVVAAHGDLAEALVSTAMSVVQKSAPVVAVGIEAGDDSAAYEARLTNAVREVGSGGGVLVLTDMFGGTPSNIGMTLHQAGAVEVLTGANLPMLIKALQLCDKEAALEDVARRVKESGARAISVASEVLAVNHPKAGREGTA